MKVIISHDIDHMTPLEHWRDLIVPKHLARMLIEFSLGRISAAEAMARCRAIAQNRWHNIEELMSFDKDRGVPATYFIAVEKGRKLCYPLSEAAKWIERIDEKGFDTGVHGIAFDELSRLTREYVRFRELAHFSPLGIRMHDIGTKARDVMIRSDELELIGRTGYLFSSNTFALTDPYRVGGLWEFPVQIMDGYLFQKDCRWQNRTVLQAKDDTEKLISAAKDKGLRYFSILFHDFFFSDSYSQWREWYRWVIEYVKENRIELTDYKTAIRELAEDPSGTEGLPVRGNPVAVGNSSKDY